MNTLLGPDNFQMLMETSLSKTNIHFWCSSSGVVGVWVGVSFERDYTTPGSICLIWTFA